MHIKRFQFSVLIILIISGLYVGQLQIETSGQNVVEQIVYRTPYLAEFDHRPVNRYNAYMTGDDGSLEWKSAVFAGLYKRNVDGRGVPDLAESMPQVSSDGLTYTVKLKENLLFSNGHKLTASDVAFSFQVAVSEKISSRYLDKMEGYLDNQSVSIEDDLTVNVQFLKQPTFPLSRLFFTIIDEASLTEWFETCEGDQTVETYNFDTNCRHGNILPEGWVSAGPFRVQQYEDIYDAPYIILEANPYYYDADVMKTDEIKFEMGWSRENEALGISNGMFDIVSGGYFLTDQEVENIPNVNIMEFKVLSASMFSVNHLNLYFGTGESIPGNTAPDYQDALSIRKAMAHIVNYDRISLDLYKGMGKPLATTMPRGTIGWDESLLFREYSVDKARDHMIQAGFDYSTLGIENENGAYEISFFDVTLLGTTTGPARNWSIDIFMEDLPKIGIGVKELIHTGWGELTPRTFGYEGTETFPLPPSYEDGGFDIFTFGLGSGLEWDPTSWFDASGRCDSGDCTNFYNFDIDETQSDVAEMVRDYVSELDFDTRIKKAKALQQLLYDNLPVIPTSSIDQLWIARDEIQGLNIDRLGSFTQDWSEVVKTGFTLNEKNTEMVKDNFDDGGEDTSTNLISVNSNFVLLVFISIELLKRKRRKISD